MKSFHEPSRPGSTATSLLAGIRARDIEAWQRMAVLYSPLVYRCAKRAGMCREDAADIVQQVFLVVHTKIDEFRRDRPGDSFRGWLFGILRNHLRHHYRNAARRPMPAGGTDALQRLNEVAAVDDPSTFSTEGLSDLCRRALEFIQAEYEQTTWMAFWRTAVEGKLPRDVAAELGLTVNAVYVARSRVVRRLREFLSENEA